MTRLSNRQYPMLRMFFENGVNGYLSIKDMQRWDQRPFRSMLIRKWVAWKPSRGFHITDDGLRAMHEFETTDIARKNAALPLTSYFDMSAYGLSKPTKKVHEMKHRGAA